MSVRAAEESIVSARALEMVTQVGFRTPSEAVSRAEQVTRQMESAIGIGILNSGDKLPPEAVLAEHLGVSTLTLRQALAVLRSKGLIETRKGRGSSSYVTGEVSVTDEQITRQLRMTQTDDLRDLLDLGASTASAAARLAAARADQQDVMRLRALASRFAAASTPAELRRMESRLHIGYGVAAQSTRLTTLMIQSQAELVPLLWGGPEEAIRHRQQAAISENDAIIEAVAEGRVADAEAAARRHFEEEAADVMDRHLKVLTDSFGPPKPLRQAVEDAARTLAESLDAVFGSLNELRHTAEPILNAQNPSRADLAVLEPIARDIIDRHHGLVEGAGLAVAPGVLSDAQIWMQSWHARSGVVGFTRHSLNPASINYYDYTEMTWFALPAASSEPSAIGPYVDFGGTDQKIVTVGMAVPSAGGKNSVAAADLSMASLEEEFLRALGPQEAAVALVTQSGKVIASNRGRFGGGRIATEVLTESVQLPLQSVSASWRVAYAA